MRRLGLLLAGAGLWLFLASIPALADGGPHVADTNNGSLTLTADSCAGCHRAHTAQGPYLIKESSNTLLCLSCHGLSTSGATVDVTTGVQYRPGTTYVRDNSLPGNQLGATRAGGFLQARLGAPVRIAYPSLKAKVTVGAAEDVTSAHLQLAGSPITAKHVAWGNGDNGSGAGPLVQLECTSCHNPHGNNQYRILRPLPEVTATSGTFTDPVEYDVASINGDTGSEYIETTVGHQFFVGDLVTLTGVTGITNGDYVVVAVPNGIRIKIAAASAWPTTTEMNLTTAGAGGTIKRTEAPVADSPVGDPDSNGVYPEKNYTVIQTKGSQGIDSTFLFYAQDVINSGYTAADGDYFHRNIPWNAGSGTTDEAPNGKIATITAAAPTLGSGDVAFNQQMTAWCATCHSRYFGYQNPNPTGNTPGTPQDPKNILDVTGNVINVQPGNNAAGHGFNVGDKVEILGLGSDGQYTISWVSTYTFTVTGGSFTDNSWTSGYPTVERKIPAATSAYFFPRVGDNIFKYQHSTRSNRVCTTCHVAHGSNVAMDGDYSSNVPYPGEVTGSASSRLLKVANRGLCTLCHDPSETLLGGEVTGLTLTSVNISSSLASNETITTASAHGFNVGDFVVITGHDAAPSGINAGFYVKTVPSATTFTVSSSAGGTTFDITANGTNKGTVAKVGGYMGSATISTSTASTDVITTSSAHGLAVNDLIVIAGHTPTTINRFFYVKSVPSTTTFTVSTSLGGATYDIAADGTGGTLSIIDLIP